MMESYESRKTWYSLFDILPTLEDLEIQRWISECSWSSMNDIGWLFKINTISKNEILREKRVLGMSTLRDAGRMIKMTTVRLWERGKKSWEEPQKNELMKFCGE